MGGAALTFIIFFCIVILCIRQSYKRKTHADNGEVSKSTSEKINMSSNPSYGFTEHNNNIKQKGNRPHSKCLLLHNTDGTIKMECNPSYEGFYEGDTDEIKSEYELTIPPSCSSKFSVAEDQHHAKPKMISYQEDESDYI